MSCPALPFAPGVAASCPGSSAAPSPQPHPRAARRGGGAEEWPPLSRARSSARGPRAAAVQVRVRPSRCPHRGSLVTATGCADVTPSRGCPQSPLGAAPPPASFWAVLLGGCPIPWHRPLAERCLRAPRASHPASVSPSRGRAWPVCPPRAALQQHQGHPGAKSSLGLMASSAVPPRGRRSLCPAAQLWRARGAGFRARMGMGGFRTPQHPPPC